MPTWSTPGTYTWVVPSGVTELTGLDLAGGQGGADWSGTATPGLGGRLQAVGPRCRPRRREHVDEALIAMGIDPDVQPFLDVLRAEIALGDKASADQIAALAKELTAVKDRLAKLEQPTTPPPPAPEVIEAVDFAKNNAGHLYPGNLVGKGSALTTLRVKPGSSTKTPPVQGSGKTTEQRVVRVGPQNNAVVKIGDYWNG